MQTTFFTNSNTKPADQKWSAGFVFPMQCSKIRFGSFQPIAISFIARIVIDKRLILFFCFRTPILRLKGSRIQETGFLILKFGMSVTQYLDRCPGSRPISRSQFRCAGAALCRDRTEGGDEQEYE